MQVLAKAATGTKEAAADGRSGVTSTGRVYWGRTGVASTGRICWGPTGVCPIDTGCDTVTCDVWLMQTGWHA